MSTIWHSCISNPVLPPPHHHPVEPACCILRPPHILLRLTHPPAQNFLLCITPFPSVFSHIRYNVTIMLFRRYVTIICPTPTPTPCIFMSLHVDYALRWIHFVNLRRALRSMRHRSATCNELRAAGSTHTSAQDTQEPSCTPAS